MYHQQCVRIKSAERHVEAQARVTQLNADVEECRRSAAAGEDASSIAAKEKQLHEHQQVPCLPWTGNRAKLLG